MREFRLCTQSRSKRPRSFCSAGGSRFPAHDQRDPWGRVALHQALRLKNMAGFSLIVKKVMISNFVCFLNNPGTVSRNILTPLMESWFIICITPWAGKMIQIARIGYPSWQAEREIKLSCLLRTTRSVPREKFPRKPNKSFIDQAYSVKMAGYWPRSFLRVYGPRLHGLGP